MKTTPKRKLEIIPLKLSPEYVYGEDAAAAAQRVTIDSTLSNAAKLKQFLGREVKYLPGEFPSDFENYTSGWNASEEELENADKNASMLFLNLDLADNGCTRKCSHCFTMDGQIDIERGRKRTHSGERYEKKALSVDRLLEQIEIARDHLGLLAVRTLGRGEPMESKYLLSFTERVHELGLRTVIFTRGHVLGNNLHVKKVYGKLGIETGAALAARFYELNASFIVGYSALDKVVHDGMVGIQDHSKHCAMGLKRLLDAGFGDHNPTRLGIEAPIAKFNMGEFPVSYTFFQCMGMSPVYNAYMVTGRSDEEYFYKHAPTLSERLEVHAQIQLIMESLGIKSKVGAYLGTKECHDVEHGLYVPSTGLVRPCPGYEGNDAIRGDLSQDDIRDIWANSRFVRTQHICEPKIAHGFPLDYVKMVEEFKGNLSTDEVAKITGIIQKISAM